MTFSDGYGHRTSIPIATFIIYNELGEEVGFSIDDGTDIKAYYYLKDVTGQIDAVVDIETNTIIYSCTYDAWGSILDEYCTDALVAYGNPLRYKDYNYDIESGLYYLQSRYYDSLMGRFINADDPLLTDTSVDNTLSTNMYTYCGNDPVNDSDPSGYIASKKIAEIVIGAIIGGITQLLADAICIAARIQSSLSSVGTYISSIASGGLDGVLHKGIWKDIIIAAIGSAISQILDKIIHKSSFSISSFVYETVRAGVKYAIAKKIKVKINKSVERKIEKNVPKILQNITKYAYSKLKNIVINSVSYNVIKSTISGVAASIRSYMWSQLRNAI